MAPSIISTLSSVLLLTSSAAATKSYQVVDSYDSTNFLDKFGFFTSDHSTGNYNDVDPTGGYVSYKSATEAQNMGLMKMVGQDLYLGMDSKSVIDPNGIGRSSVRIETKTKYKQGLFVASFSHLPKPVCGAWPAFWTVGNPWPSGGEIDIYETWNEDNVNKVVLHTDEKIGECRIDGKNMSGTVSKPNCANFAAGQSDNEGCAGLDAAAPFGSPEGGVYAMEWTDDAVRVWGFTHADVPADLSKPETFGNPSFTTSTCAADKLFGEASLIINLDLCGVSGNEGIWDAPGGCAAKTGGATCKEWVAKNPAAFADVYFQLKSIKIYSLKEGEAVTSVTSQVASTVASTSVAETAVSSVLSSGITSEKPAETTSGAVPTASVIASDKPAETAVSSVLSSGIISDNPAETASGAVPTSAPTSVIASDQPAETPAESLTTRLATSTVYETSIKTITSCRPEVTNCPARHTPVVVTETVAISTTICPVFDISTELTVSKTEVVTVTSCAGAGTANCAAQTSTITTHEVIPTTTAIPVESYVPPKPTGGKPAGGVTTELIPASTTEGQKPAPATTDMPTVLTTYMTNIITVTSCAPEVVNCPARLSTVVTSQLISTTIPVPVPGVPAIPTGAHHNPPVPGSGEPATTPGPTTPGSGSDSGKPSVPIVGVPPVGAPSVGVPTAGVPTAGVPPADVPTAGVPPSLPTTLVVAPSSPFNGTLTSARTPVGTGSSSPCIGAACPATTTGPVLAGAGKLGTGSLLLAAVLAVFVM
ncbi:mixed-linked glucanase [Colletotrichum graminicola]|uniref:Mixed-linked glucanase n=1 Tax=Colletotrichum graminicola (strain M1.001 / M2 / FGSC 10212) TaxID=645133 RepID=E3QMG1_COLGM|nr:mixed-linked glucanase [Colletotrichum graminicola M1.001]EFQ32049.1 mixed-linked glucanase [Colletotrichum graminicola M1.001]WDK17068.1 mixed-linked glucanase [Colletotrichum graminicola]